MFSGAVDGGDIDWRFSPQTERKIILAFLKEMAGVKKNSPNYALADFYDEKGLPQIGKYVRNKQ